MLHIHTVVPLVCCGQYWVYEAPVPTLLSLKDNGYDDESYTLNDSVYENRITQLNLTMKKEVNAKNRYRRQIKKLKKENKRLKEENEKILSSNSWKITKPLRKLRNK